MRLPTMACWRWRAEVVAEAPKAGGVRRPRRRCEGEAENDACSTVDPDIRPRRLDWAQLLWRSFTTDVLTCTTCGGRRKVLALRSGPELDSGHPHPPGPGVTCATTDQATRPTARKSGPCFDDLRAEVRAPTSRVSSLEF